MPNSHVLERPIAAPTRKIHTITILGGQGKNRLPEPLRQVDLKMGDIVSVVGPTGCGKTTLINDVELYANGNTPTGRTVLINGEPLPEDYLSDPSSNPIALISQHTNFLSDLPVNVFLETHARIRGVASPARAVEATVNFANQLTGEPIILENAMTELSGGQTRFLLIADAIVIGNSPIILLDEIENAGIHRTRALEMLKGYEKVFIFVTHDPRIALAFAATKSSALIEANKRRICKSPCSAAFGHLIYMLVTPIVTLFRRENFGALKPSLYVSAEFAGCWNVSRVVLLFHAIPTRRSFQRADDSGTCQEASHSRVYRYESRRPFRRRLPPSYETIPTGALSRRPFRRAFAICSSGVCART